MNLRLEDYVIVNQQFNEETYELHKIPFWKRILWLEYHLELVRGEDYYICVSANDNYTRIPLRIYDPTLNCNLQNVFITFRIQNNGEFYLLNQPGINMNNLNNWNPVNEITSTDLIHIINEQYEIHHG